MVRAIACVLLFTGCSSVTEVTRPVTEELGEFMLSAEDERRLGDQLAAKVKEKQQLVQDESVQRYVDRVGQQIVAAVPKEKKRFDYDFTVLAKPDSVNAFALPGGHVFVNSGLIRAADSEAELASVLAHEVAHVVADHPSQQMAAQVGAKTLRQLALGAEPGMLTQIASQIATRGYLAAHTRESEEQADQLGVKYLARAGYDPQAMAKFFAELAAMRQGERNPVEEFFATHPAPGERASEVRDLIQKHGYGPGQQAVVGGFEEVRAALGGPLQTGGQARSAP